MKAKLLEVEVDGVPYKALIMNNEHLAVLTALAGRIGGQTDTTWRKFSDEIYFACIYHVEAGGCKNPLHDKVLYDLDSLSIEAKETENGTMF
jgi:hypothetical protein